MSKPARVRIGFVTALLDEAKTLAGADLPSHHLVTAAGVGNANAHKAATQLIENGAEALVSWGTAGGLQREYGPGTLVIYDASLNEEGRRFASDPRWTARLSKTLASLHPVCKPGFSASAAIASANEKIALGGQFQCAALDMESATVATCADLAGLPFVAVRAIVDPAAFDLPRAALAALDENGEVRLTRVARGLLRAPEELPSLIKLAWWYRLALRRLSAAARILRPTFATE